MQQNAGLLLAKRAALNPDLEGCVETVSGRRFSYHELNLRANRAANMLLSLNVKKGDRVALLMMNGVEFVETFFAIAKIGAICVPLNWRLTADELCFILKDSGATLLLYSDDFENTVSEIHARGEKETDLRIWIGVGEPQQPFAKSYDALTSTAATDEPEITAAEDDTLFIMYTSGTTGLPKGAVHTHNSTIWSSLTILATTENRKKDRYLLVLPLFHVGALSPLINAIHGGAMCVIMRNFDLNEIWKAIEREKITTMLAVPAMLNFMLQTDIWKETDYSTLRWIMSGAAPVPVNLIKRYAEMDIAIHQVYGMTETGGPACMISGDDALKKAGSTGRAFFHTNVRVIDNDGNDIAAGEIGEVIISGPNMMKEYWKRPEASAETIRDGWVFSGDLATIDEDGFVYIHDRKKDMIISGGENIYPAEVENVLLGHKQVKDVAVIGQPDETWGEIPLAVIVTDNPALKLEDIVKFCGDKLARFKMPKAVELIDEIPRNPTGKALKRILREKFCAQAN